MIFTLFLIVIALAYSFWIFSIYNTKKLNLGYLRKKYKLREFAFPNLDVRIKLNDTGYDTCVQRKLKNTGLLVNLNALCPKPWKSGLIMSLLHRAKKICSSTELLVQQLKRLHHIFCNNGYPDWCINNTIKKFEKRQNNPPNKYEPIFFSLLGHHFLEKHHECLRKH